jgi:hypothetical protein
MASAEDELVYLWTLNFCIREYLELSFRLPVTTVRVAH